MPTTSIHLRIDEQLKGEFEKFCKETGLTMSTAICLFAANVVKNQELPFSVSTKK